MSLPRYPTYKDSGVEWLGEVPAHWDVKPVKSLAAIVNGYPFDSALFDPLEGVPLVRIRDLGKVETETFYNGRFVDTAAITSADVLIGMDGDFNVGRWLGEGQALLNQRMCCIRGKTSLLTKWLEYCLPARLKAINDLTYATTVKHLASSQVEKTLVAVPPEAEQAHVAAFLDRETAKIDALVAEQQRLIALLKDKRQAVISHAVTKGLNHDAPMKDSGIEWLGDVPAHWTVARLGYYSTVENGTTPNRERLDYWEDGTVPWLASGEVNQRRVSMASEYITERALHECSLRLIPAGAVVIGMIGQGKTRGLSALLEIDATINQNLAAIVTNQRLLSAYLEHALTTAYVYLREFGRGGQQAALNCEILKSLRVPIPGIEEQDAICAHLQRALPEFDTLTTEAQRAIELLQERRTALISAAVTGQIDVRPAAECAAA